MADAVLVIEPTELALDPHDLVGRGLQCMDIVEIARPTRRQLHQDQVAPAETLDRQQRKGSDPINPVEPQDLGEAPSVDAMRAAPYFVAQSTSSHGA